ncbi:MAG: ParB N-terminal domain-containing protein [Deltaproteobacteria bacterium]|nr:ParB N-terminal domain-containing protein [Deltaproteobacteria bacterium]
MTMANHCEGSGVTIPLSEVPETPGPYAMSFGFEVSAMAVSIERVGLLNRPVVERDGEGSVHVVTGYRRLMALRVLQWKEAPCTDLGAAGLSFRQKLLMAFYDNLPTREFNDVEKAMVLDRLLQCHAREEVISFFMPLLGLPSRDPLLETYLQSGSLGGEIKLALARKQVSLQTIRLLLDMDEDARFALSDWLLELKFSDSYQQKFIEYIDDISHREGLRVRQVLSEDGLLALLHDEKQNQPQKIRAIMESLRQRRFPDLTRAEKAFRYRVRALKPPTDVRIEHPPGFESPGYRLEVRFSDGKSLRKKLMETASLQGLDTLGDPWKESS